MKVVLLFILLKMNNELLLQKMFTNIYYVNVDEHEKRNIKFLSQFSDDAITSDFVKRIDAVKPASKIVEQNPELLNLVLQNRNHDVKYHWRQKLPIERLYINHLYELCCSLSHAKLLKEAIEVFQKSPDVEHTILVLEDDSRIHFDKLKSIDMINIIQEKYDICYAGSLLFTEDLSGWLTKREYHIDCSLSENNTGKLYNATSGFFGTFGYIVKINCNNIHKLKTLINELSSGSIADFCLSSQQYLVKKSVQSFFVNVAEEETSTINQASTYDINQYVNPNLSELGLVNGLTFHKSKASIFNTRNKSATFKWLFIKMKNKQDLKKYGFESDQLNDFEKLLMYVEKNMSDVEFAYTIDYSDLSRPWYGAKSYIKKKV